MCDGIIENQTASMIEPYFDVRTARDRQPRAWTSSTPRSCKAGRRPARRPRVPAALPRAGRPGGPPGARRRRGGARGERLVRHAAAPRPHPGRPSRRPAALPAPRRARQRPGAVGGARGADDRAHAAGARAGGLAPASTRSGRSARHGATLVMGSDWSVSTPDPFLQMEIAVTRALRPTRATSASRSSPRSGSSSSTRSRRSRPARRTRNHLDEAGDARRRAGWRTSRSSTATCSTRAAGPIGETRSSPRSSRASSSTRRPGLD